MATKPRGDDLLSAAAELVADRTATSRSQLRVALGVSASTTSTIVKKLIDMAVIAEVGAGPTTGGRRPTLLEAINPPGVIVAAELGGRHARMAVCDPGGDLLSTAEIPLEIETGPELVLPALIEHWQAMIGSQRHGAEILVATLALPGPVNAVTGEVIAPSRMPGWHGTRPGEVLRTLLEVPVVIENDARAAALGESVIRGPQAGDFIYVKAGTGIGAGFISHGELFYGAGGVAGDIAHVKVVSDPDRRCSCGRLGCLESVASGAVIRAELARVGISTQNMTDLIRLAQQFDPVATAATRTAGDRLGRALAPLVNFLNPASVVIGGALSGVDSFVAATRSALYDSCLAMCTQNLTIEPTKAGADAALRGLSKLARAHISLPKVGETQ